MSSLSDMMSSAIALMMSAAFVHFGVSGGTPPAQHKPAPPPAVQVSSAAASSSVSDAPPVPGDDDRFTGSPSAAAGVHASKDRHAVQ